MEISPVADVKLHFYSRNFFHEFKHSHLTLVRKKNIRTKHVRLAFYRNSDHLSKDCIQMIAVTTHEQQRERLREKVSERICPRAGRLLEC